MELALLAARLALVALFATAGLAKLADLDGSRRAVADFGVLARFLGTLLPALELAVAAALLPDRSARWGRWPLSRSSLPSAPESRST